MDSRPLHDNIRSISLVTTVCTETLHADLWDSSRYKNSHGHSIQQQNHATTSTAIEASAHMDLQSVTTLRNKNFRLHPVGCSSTGSAIPTALEGHAVVLCGPTSLSIPVPSQLLNVDMLR